jgi:hypothetical protein
LLETTEILGSWSLWGMINLSIMVPICKTHAVFSSISTAESSKNPPVVPGEEFLEFVPDRPWKATARKKLGQRLLKMMIESDPGFMEINLREHEIAR